MPEQSSSAESLEKSFDAMEEWLKTHPVEIPKEIIERRAEWERRLDDPLLSQEDWKKILDESREITKSGTEEGKYHRLAQLREASTMSGVPGEIYLLERELSNCFCGSGKKFKKCHGA
ncbi:MAG: SEC-C domain-containing protein [Patescibacteria group bacterium]